MIKKIVIIQCAAILALSIFLQSRVFSQEDVTAVKDSAFKERMRPRAVFFHDAHNETAEIEECNVCHHVYKNGELWSKMNHREDSECSECHLKAGDKAVFTLVKVYHQRCRSCHLEQKKGPVACCECHVKD